MEKKLSTNLKNWAVPAIGPEMLLRWMKIYQNP